MNNTFKTNCNLALSAISDVYAIAVKMAVIRLPDPHERRPLFHNVRFQKPKVICFSTVFSWVSLTLTVKVYCERRILISISMIAHVCVSGELVLPHE